MLPLLLLLPLLRRRMLDMALVLFRHRPTPPPRLSPRVSRHRPHPATPRAIHPPPPPPHSPISALTVPAPQTRRKCAPNCLKSFLEKTLEARETPRSAVLAFVLLAALIPACDPAPTHDLHVFAAASLREALTQSADAFQHANPNVRIVPSFAGSQLLRLQIESGARADLIITANPHHLDALHRAGLLLESPTVVATNQLVLAVPAANPAGISGLQDLTQPNRRVVMAAESVPAGAYARQMLNLHAQATGQPAFPDAVLRRVISFETNVRQVAAKLELAEADAGFVYRTDVLASNGRLQTIQTPPQIQVTATYPTAVLRDAADPQLAQRFLTFLRTPEAQAILGNHGFGPAP